MFNDRQIGNEHVVLRTETEAVSRLGHVSADVEAVDETLPGGGRINAGQDRHRRRLTRSIVPEEGGHTATISLLGTNYEPG